MAPTPTLLENVFENHIKYWQWRYESKATGWMVKNVHPFLLQNINNLKNSSSKRIFVPLCGITYDLGYLYGQGFEVFGVEGVESCFGILNERDGLGLKYNEKDSTYETSDGRLKIYHGDLYACPIEKFGPFDYVWDRAAFVAIEPKFRENYSNLMKKAIGFENGKIDNDFQYIIEMVRYDMTKFPGPPRSITEEELRKYYPGFNCEILQRVKKNGSNGFFNVIPKDVEVEETVYCLTLAKN